MSPIRVVVIHIIPNQPPQMLFVDRDDVVENLTAATSDPAFCDSVLPWRLNTRALRLQAGCLQECNHLTAEFRVVVQQDVAVWIRSGKHFSQLLHYPIGSRMTGDMDMENSAVPVFNNEEAIQKFESQCGHGKEIHGDDCFAMVGEEGQPALGWITAASKASQISGHCALGDFKTKLQKFTVNSQCVPI